MRKSTAGAPKTARSAAGQEQRRRRGPRSPPKRRAITFCTSPWGWFSIAPADENAQRERQNIPFETRREKARGVDPTLRGGLPVAPARPGVRKPKRGRCHFSIQIAPEIDQKNYGFWVSFLGGILYHFGRVFLNCELNPPALWARAFRRCYNKVLRVFHTAYLSLAKF